MLATRVVEWETVAQGGTSVASVFDPSTPLLGPLVGFLQDERRMEGCLLIQIFVIGRGTSSRPLEKPGSLS